MMEICIICEKLLHWEFTIFHGQGACVRCGAPYGIKGFNDLTETVSSLSEKGIPLLKEYWKATNQYLGLGMFIPKRPDADTAEKALNEWIAKNHPEIPKDNK